MGCSPEGCSPEGCSPYIEVGCGPQARSPLGSPDPYRGPGSGPQGPIRAQYRGRENISCRSPSQNIKTASTFQTDPLNPAVFAGYIREGRAERAPPGPRCGSGAAPRTHYPAGPRGPRRGPDTVRGRASGPAPDPERALFRVFEKCPKTKCRFLLKF